MEDTCRSMNNPGTQKGYLFEVFRGGTCKFTWNDRVIPRIGRYSGLIWNNFGLRILMHKQNSCVVQVKASKRLRSDQLESDNSKKHALRLTNIG